MMRQPEDGSFNEKKEHRRNKYYVVNKYNIYIYIYIWLMMWGHAGVMGARVDVEGSRGNFLIEGICFY